LANEKKMLSSKLWILISLKIQEKKKSALPTGKTLA